MYRDLIINASTTVVNASSQLIVEATKVFNDVAGTTAVDRYMDAVSGFGHRIVHGHSLDNLPVIYEKLGLSGVGDYFVHGLRDVMSPHGMPIPFAKQIQDSTGLSDGRAIDLLSPNIGDLLSGGFSVAHSIYLTKKIQQAMESGRLDEVLSDSLAISILTKFSVGLVTTNPVTLVSSIYDVGLIAYTVAAAPTETFTETSHYSLNNKLQKITFAATCGGLAGACVAMAAPTSLAVSAAGAGGYFAGTWLYDRLASKNEDEDGDPFFPDFLTD
jgi:hypothetical protein